MNAFDTEKVLQEVPRMRRYAALLCLGDRDRGDQLVEATLIDLMAKPLGLNSHEESYRIALFRAMNVQIGVKSDIVPRPADVRIGCEGNAKNDHVEPAGTEAACRMLAQMPVEQRSALLLVVIESMSYSDAARVLGTTTAIVKALLVDARACMETGDEQQSLSA